MATRKRVKKPAPVVIATICSVCGEDWGQHEAIDGEVSTLECVRLLKAKIARTPVYAPTYIQPYTPWRWNPVTVTYTTGNTSSWIGNTSTMTYNSATPVVATAKAA